MFLHFEHIAEHRVRSFVWFLVSLFNPLFFILYWIGAFAGKKEIVASWTISSTISYYFILTIVSASLMSHVEEDVAKFDIQQGELVNYLLKPFPYILKKFFEEIHYRVLQGVYALIVFGIFSFFLGKIINVSHDPKIIFISFIIALLAYSISFLFKMITAFICFWTTDIMGLNSMIDVLMVLFAGFLMPLPLLPPLVAKISYFLPFAYIIYFPTVAFQGKLSVSQLLQVIGGQAAWIIIFFIIYQLMWKKGIRDYTGVSQ